MSSGTSEATSDGGVPVASASSAPSDVPNPEPTVELPAGVEALFPVPGATDLCPDPTLHVRFSGKPRLGTRGKVQVFEVANPGTPVAGVDLSQATITDTLGGSTFTLPIGAYVDGNEAVFTLPARGLGYGKTFYVTVESGVLTTPEGTAWGITDTETWRFTTADARTAGADTLRVALDGSGQYCTVQAAIDAAEDDTTIQIGEGNYYGVVYFKDKHGLTLRGDDRTGTALKGVNNNNLNPSTRGRALIGAEDLTDLVIENLTIHNLTPQDGSQAEALTLLSCDRCIVRDADIRSLQDTLLWSGRVYADNCYISGNVDYIWGTGAVYFNACEIHTTGRKGYNVQARNAQDGHGYVFVDSKLTSDAGVTGDILARIDVSQYPSSEVAYINCEMGSNIAPQGWLISGGSAPASLRFVEYQSRDPSGNLVNVSQRLAGSRQLSASEAAVYRDPAQVLGGWTPEGP